jgi:hypothetical protein
MNRVYGYQNKEKTMSKGGSGSKGGTGKSGGANQSGRPSSHPGPGGNWPSTTGNQSGGDRGNTPAKK